MTIRTPVKGWNELSGKTIERVTLHNQFDRNTIAIIFTDGTYALLESSTNGIIELKEV